MKKLFILLTMIFGVLANEASAQVVLVRRPVHRVVVVAPPARVAVVMPAPRVVAVRPIVISPAPIIVYRTAPPPVVVVRKR